MLSCPLRLGRHHYFLIAMLGWVLNLPAAHAGSSKTALPAKKPAPAEVAARVVSFEGTVLIRNADPTKTSPQLRARTGLELRPGDVVNTSSDGKVKLLFQDKTIIDLGPSSLFEIKGYSANSGTDRQADLELPYGTMRAAVGQKITGKGHFRLKTRAVTMGVRGTMFVVDTPVYEDHAEIAEAPKSGQVQAAAVKKNPVTVIEGSVDVQNKQPSQAASSAGAPKPAAVILNAGEALPASSFKGGVLAAPATQGNPGGGKIQVPATDLQQTLKAATVVNNYFDMAITYTAKDTPQQQQQQQENQRSDREPGEKGGKNGKAGESSSGGTGGTSEGTTSTATDSSSADSSSSAGGITTADGGTGDRSPATDSGTEDGGNQNLTIALIEQTVNTAVTGGNESTSLPDTTSNQGFNGSTTSPLQDATKVKVPAGGLVPRYKINFTTGL